MQQQKETIWSPYGHEGARRALLNQRRAQVAAAALAIALLYGMFLMFTLEEQSSATDRGVEIDQPEQKPITVTVTPGRMAEHVTAGGTPADPADPPRAAHQQQNKIVETLQPFLMLILPLAAAFWVLSRIGSSAHGRLAELNLGVYKGAMPYELHAARAYKKVFTHREVDAHVFGKTREDFLFGSYLGSPPIAIRQLLGEDFEVAQVAAIRRGGARKVTVTASPAPRGPSSPFDPLLAPLRRQMAALKTRLPRRDPRAARLRQLKRQARGQ